MATSSRFVGSFVRPFVRLLTAGLITLGLAAGSVHAQFKSRTVRLSFGGAQDNPTKNGFDALLACTQAKSDGKMKLRVFYDGVLGADLSATQSVRTGSIDMTLTSTAPLVSMIPALGVFDLPFLFDTPEEADQVLDGTVGNWLLEQLPAVGVVGLGWWENGFRNATNSKHAVANLADFGGLKMRVMQSPIALDLFNTLGTNAMPLSFSELYSALETRTVDGQENPLALIKSTKFYEVQKYLTLSKHVYTPYVLLVSGKLWNGLSADERSTLQACALEAGTTQRQAMRAAEAQTLEFLRAEGMQVSEIAASDMQSIRARTQAVQQRAAGIVGQEVVDMINAELQKIRNQ